jgi:hydroxysqualene dehydroxylase
LGRRVVIIGGGLSGLAAGVALCCRGHEVILLERRNHLGGRAYSFLDSKTRDTVDNGQHLFMGCYRHTIDFLKKIDCLDRLSFQDRLRVEFLDRSTGLTVFQCPKLPPPFHVLAGLFKLRGISLKDKSRALRVGQAIRQGSKPGQQSSPADLTVLEWLKRLKQTDRMNERFWYPLSIATLNEDPAIASAIMLRKVLEEAFARDTDSARIGISRVGLSELYTTGARDFIESRGGQIRTAAHVSELMVEDRAVTAARLKDGETIEADLFISAVPPRSLAEMLPDGVRQRDFPQIGRLESSPILSINLWLDRPVIHRQFVGLLGTNVQWLFNKDLIIKPGKKSNQLALIISAARDFIDLSREALVRMALNELHELVPASRQANLLHSVVVKEREATLSHTVESNALRPGPQTAISNLILAGDWTDTGLPATIESAVMSGNIAAHIVDSTRS